MNRLTREMVKVYSDSFKAGLIFTLLSDTDMWSYVIKKITENAKANSNGFAPSDHATKYLTRAIINYSWLEDKTITTYKNERLDRLEIVECESFTGRFSFDKQKGGFVPVMRDIKCTKLLRDFYVERNESRIIAQWNQVSASLCCPSGNDASLIYKFHEQHVYFMKNQASGEIKIGISYNPEVRRKQIQYSENGKVEILHIVNGGGRELERSLHHKFKKHRTRGEWFKPHKSILDYIDTYKETLKAAA